MFARQIEVNVVNLMEQCNQWHQERQFKKIIDAIEAIPEHARSTEQIMELARAYNNYGLEHDYSYFEKTLELLRPIMQKMRHSPNFFLRYGFVFDRYLERAYISRLSYDISMHLHDPDM